MATGGLNLENWRRIFQSEAGEITSRHNWSVEFDQENPGQDWKNYIRNTSATFNCSDCRRSWPSNQVKVIFYMILDEEEGQGTVKMWPCNQNCKNCQNAPMMFPNINDENIRNLMKNLVKKIRKKCYRDQLDDEHYSHYKMEVKSPHEPKHCEGCIRGICTGKDQ